MASNSSTDQFSMFPGYPGCPRSVAPSEPSGSPFPWRPPWDSGHTQSLRGASATADACPRAGHKKKTGRVMQKKGLGTRFCINKKNQQSCISNHYCRCFVCLFFHFWSTKMDGTKNNSGSNHVYSNVNVSLQKTQLLLIGGIKCFFIWGNSTMQAGMDKQKNTSSDPNHDISRCIFGHIFYIFGQFIWHIFWHSIWHIFWHPISYVLAFYLALYLAYILTFYLAFYLTYSLTWYLAYILTFYLTYSDILSGIQTDIYSDMVSGISYDIVSGILSDKYSHIQSGILSDINSVILSDICSGILSGILLGI